MLCRWATGQVPTDQPLLPQCTAPLSRAPASAEAASIRDWRPTLPSLAFVALLVVGSSSSVQNNLEPRYSTPIDCDNAQRFLLAIGRTNCSASIRGCFFDRYPIAPTLQNALLWLTKAPVNSIGRWLPSYLRNRPTAPASGDPTRSSQRWVFAAPHAAEVPCPVFYRTGIGLLIIPQDNPVMGCTRTSLPKASGRLLRTSCSTSKMFAPLFVLCNRPS